jgi:hypothetical protein
MGRRRIIAFLGLAALSCWPAAAEAQRYYGRGGRGGTVMSPFGPLYNTNTPEYRMSGGNPFVMQQLMQQKQWMLQQQMMLRQQQQYQKLQKQQGKNQAQGQGSQFQAAGGSNARSRASTGKTTRRHPKRHRTATSASGKATAPALGAATPPASSTGSPKSAAKP